MASVPVFCRDFWAERKKAREVGTILNALRVALRINSGIRFLFGIQKSLRAFLNPLFTGGVVKANGICHN